MLFQFLVGLFYFTKYFQLGIQHRNDVFHIVAHDVIVLAPTIKCGELSREKIWRINALVFLEASLAQII